jgi:hypothetical protein
MEANDYSTMALEPTFLNKLRVFLKWHITNKLNLLNYMKLMLNIIFAG